MNGPPFSDPPAVSFTPEERVNETHALLTIPHGERSIVVRPVESGWHLIFIQRRVGAGVVYEQTEGIFTDIDSLLKAVKDLATE